MNFTNNLARPAPPRGRRIQLLRAFRRTDTVRLCIGSLVLWCLGCLVSWPISRAKKLPESLQSGCSEVLLWSWGLGKNSLEGRLASRLARKGQVEPEVAQVGPKMGPRGLQELSCRILSLFLAPFWAHLGPILGPSWPFLGPSRGFREGILRHTLGLERLV